MQAMLPIAGSALAIQPAATGNTSAASNEATQASVALAPSASVTLTDLQAALAAQTYTPAGSLNPAVASWESEAADTITSIMSRNYAAGTLGGRFAGLGAALMGHLATDGGNYAQSVLRSASADPANATALDQVRRSQLHNQADNQVTLQIQTRGGASVTLTLGSQAGGLAVQIQVSNGTLSDAERNALAGLGAAFQAAIDGLAGEPPTLALEGLTRFDSSVLSSVDLNASFTLADGSAQTLAFHADSQERSVAFTGAIGTVSVNVDMSNAGLIGSAEQQARALDTYVSQIEQAGIRGRGNASLVQMFEDAFTTLNSHYPPQTGAPVAAAGKPIGLDDTDRGMLTGLADFSASVRASDAPSINPLQPDELDTFAYQFSQQTRVEGADARNRSIEQSQQAHLTASYHQSLYPDTPLNLTDKPESQNYYFYQLDDTASSVARIGYRDGALVEASIEQSANRSTRIMKYVMGDLQQDAIMPSQVSRTFDLLDRLGPGEPDNRSPGSLDMAIWRDTLAAASSLALMKTDPALLRAARFDMTAGHTAR
ncbi:hypothetical protein [Bordetella genomosp. 9]|uniref:Lactate dehydrogenase n=1 Tax=Bordetella genomosp. 9 TaxID=1416803 RepID=A0A1W6YXB4_9BORD|nr:hypothetical protein [Bordetella genomosp. 9]ARP85696.1 hypothetical protein CAL13_05360 [Bordetella genomosp. 9]